jgi:hypothetical protein
MTADRTLLDVDRMPRGRCRAPEGQARLANRNRCLQSRDQVIARSVFELRSKDCA